MASLKSRVKIDRPERYAKQLASHFQKAGTSVWDERSKTGWSCFENSDRNMQGKVDYWADESFLYLHVQANNLDNAQKISEIVSTHLLRFANKQSLEFNWVTNN